MAQLGATIIGGAYLTLADDSTLTYQVDEGGDTLQVTVLGPMELGIGMSPVMLERCQELLVEAMAEVHRARQAADPDA